jgi:putative ABC transport system permease protein
MNLWTYTTREGQRRPGRTLLTLTGIALGLATVVATRLTVPTIEHAYRDLFENLTGRASLEVAAPGQAGFDPAVSRELTTVTGVRAVLPRIRGVVSVVGKDGPVAVPVLGLDPAGLTAEDMPPLGDGEMLLDAGLAEALGARPGEAVRMWAPAGQTELRLAGFRTPRGPDAALGGVGFLSLAWARQLFALPDQVNSLELLLEEGVEADKVCAAVAFRLPAGVAVQPPGGRGDLARTTLRATAFGLAALAFLAVTAAAFVILNTFLLNLGERRGQLAVLRALGATRSQVRGLLLREALLLGLAGTAAGCAGGVILAWGLLHVLGKFLHVPLPAPHLGAGPFALPAVLGPGAALAAAWVPAWCASRRQPLDDLLPQRGRPGECLSCRICQAGLVLLGLGILLAAGLCSGWLPVPACPALLAPALALVLTGCVLLLPGATGPLLQLAATLPLGLTGKLAAQHLARRRLRTGLTAGVLFLAVAVAVGFGHCLRGILCDLQRWCRNTVVADFLVRGSMPDTAFLLAAPLPESLAEEIGREKEVGGVDRLAFLPAEAEGRPVLVLARDFAPGWPLPLDLREGDPGTVLEGLRAGEAVLGTGLSQQLGLHRGGTLTLETSHGPRQIRVAGTATEYAGGGSALYLEWQAAGRLLAVPGPHVLLVRAGPGGAAALGPPLKQFCDRRHLLVQSNAEFAGMIDMLLARVTGLLWALMALVFVLASLGIVNTLTMNVREQQRELGVLRALGLKGGQVGKVVLAQSGLLGVLGLFPGALVGVGLAYLIDRGTSWVGPPIPFAFDGQVIAGCCLLALGTAVVAALLPGRRAARMPVLQALAD